MNKLLFTLLLLALTAYAQQERIAIINTLDDYDSISIADLTYLTDRLRETAVNVLPAERFGVMTTESIVAFLGSMENTVRVCKESSCLAELGRMVSADYVAQGRIGRFGENLTIKVELYNVKTGNLMGSFTGNFKDIYSALALIDEKAADLFKRMLAEPKPIVVEKPEVAKSDPAPVKPELEDQRVSLSSKKNSFWVAVGLDLAGAAVIYAGYRKNNEMVEAYETYKKFGPFGNYKDSWEEAESARSSRNMLYIVGGIVLASGLGVHIWF